VAALVVSNGDKTCY